MTHKGSRVSSTEQILWKNVWFIGNCFQRIDENTVTRISSLQTDLLRTAGG